MSDDLEAMQIVGHQLIHSWFSVETEILKLFKNEANNTILWLKTVVQTVHCYPVTDTQLGERNR